MSDIPPHFKSSSFDETIYIGFGSNVGDREQNFRTALSMLQAENRILFKKCSSFIETEPWGGVAQPFFLNCVAKILTSFSPMELLQFLKKSEQQIGRIPTERWGPRVIDMDILLFGQRVIDTEQLTIPHRELKNRSFVLGPLQELDADLVHPVCKTPLGQFL